MALNLVQLERVGAVVIEAADTLANHGHALSTGPANNAEKYLLSAQATLAGALHVVEESLKELRS